MSKAPLAKRPPLSPWSGNTREKGHPPETRRPQPNGNGPALCWERTLVGAALASVPVLLWPLLILFWAALISLEPGMLIAAGILGYLGTLFFWWLLLPFAITQTAALGLFVALMRALHVRMYWWQPILVATAALSAHKVWFWDYTRWDHAIEVSLIAGVPAGLLFWGATAGWVWSANGPRLAICDQSGETP
jgi:hypothetical protein